MVYKDFSDAFSLKKTTFSVCINIYKQFLSTDLPNLVEFRAVVLMGDVTLKIIKLLKVWLAFPA